MKNLKELIADLKAGKIENAELWMLDGEDYCNSETYDVDGQAIETNEVAFAVAHYLNVHRDKKALIDELELIETK